jgi:hypothetical protein
VRSSDKTFSCILSRLNVEDGFFFFFLSAAQNNLCFDLTFLNDDDTLLRRKTAGASPSP